ncbi:MAG: bifunctional glutamate N-acetyltransferase/amino-acid acetyltransferase ArgJ [Sagittula sp.]|jgi:glutamate N-acetyltransferase/amino-acid N-acetyltransferase|uniref:bifunctional glutamate N-acetyltransferase/amino-acid acetyltransferase ArgJ n=1 Tax=unclassified Sagittula TaxID=2624628 RepID=UPI000C2D5976|nr:MULTISPECIES: bifunctional glutamate N-acetyltransferase/amino-acid acetyltransferase ArgJ [unclassified Sagittula]AUC53751.1 bifunctional ornithine acetyltransferase/N-acetylglutamate synthase [Sagittula sp. P11]WHZ35378.1 bifunctional glutamate N-acetyltransferase/amino-acid acetyltransferase ArgJ [Sagittula sp. MA-2]
MPPKSPLAPETFPDLPVIAGVRLSAVAAGVKYKNRTDVMLAVLDPGSVVAGVFTRSATRSAPVLDCQAKLAGEGGEGAAILVNSGNSNAFTGRAGDGSVAAICAAVSAATGLPAERVFTASTGVIGVPLPHDRIIAKLDEAVSALSAEGISDAAAAIMTTDTFPKGASAEVSVGGKTVKIAGIAKGSGMIAPDMATMLVYMFTDAKIGRADLQKIVSEANARTFNNITVDSDTSTSDSLIMGATGASGVDVTGNADFAAAVEDVMRDLAHQVVRDGEGATKFVTVTVTGAATDADARTHALSIANSPLVKTAIAGEDPNWGRIVMAVGKSGAAADRDRLTIRFGDVLVAEKGWVAESYAEEQGAAVMKQAEIPINVDIGLGTGTATVWTCDLTHGYITINADYRS